MTFEGSNLLLRLDLQGLALILPQPLRLILAQALRRHPVHILHVADIDDLDPIVLIRVDLMFVLVFAVR